MLFLHKNKTEIISTAIVFVCFVFFILFPNKNLFQEIVISVAFLLILPIFFIKIILRRNLRDYGLKFKFDKKNLLLSIVFTLILICALYAIMTYTELLKNYQPSEVISGNFKYFLVYEILGVGFFTVLFEFFFRGFVVIGLGNFLHYWAVLIQFIMFLFLYSITGFDDWSFFLYAIASPFAGLIAYQTKSLAYSFPLTYFFIVFADAILIFSKR